MGNLGTASGTRKKVRRRKPDELVSSVVRETAIPAAVELMRANARFVFPSGTAWVILVLAADAVGGLSRRHSRDEAKGSIIELIDSDQIKTVATAEMLAEEIFGIIPSPETLSRMAEYSLLTSADYAWAVVWQKPSGDLLIDLVNEATFTQAREVASGTRSLEEAVGEQAWTDHSGLTTDETQPNTVPNTVSNTVSHAVSNAVVEDDGDEIFDPISGEIEDADLDAVEPGFNVEPVFDTTGEEPDFDEEPIGFTTTDFTTTELTAQDAAAVAVEAEVEPVFDETGGFDELDGEAAGLDDSEATARSAEEEVLAEEMLLEDQAQVRHVIARRFLSEDLDLDVRLDEFNATFAIGAPVVQIEVPQGATQWLGEQVAWLNRQANADLAQLRWAHEDELRTLYVNLMSTHVEQVIRDVATDREGSRYKWLKDGTEQAHREREAERDQRIRARKAEILKDYEAQATRLAEQAAIQAEIQYKERNRSRMEREQADAVAEVERVIENTYSHDLQEILRVRRADAAVKMQIGTTRIFEVLAEQQKAYLEAEEERLGQWKAEIAAVVDENRKADIAQAEALTEHQRTTDEVGELRREQEALVESMRSEHADRIRRMEDELDRSRKDAITQMQARDAQWRHGLEIERVKTESATKRNTDLLEQMGIVEDSVRRRYEERLVEMATDKDSYARELARASQIQSRYNKMTIVLIVALPVLGALAGFIGGAAGMR